MTAALKFGEVADTPGEFFAPADTDLIDSLISQYQRDRHRIDEVVAFTKPERLGSVLHYFIQGNSDRFDRFTSSVAKLFGEDGAVAALNADYWQRALNMTDVLDFMPAKRREEWFESIQKMDTPDFEDATVRATLGTLLAQRMDFLAEKVDGIFQALSRKHVTNQPEGFGKRMILTGVTNDWGDYSRRQAGHINDLRQVIAKFMCRDEPNWNATNRMVEIARKHHRGEWLPADGGAIRIRCYLNGNAHLEVHPDMAWRLNQVLAHLHPMAIPSEFRTAPKRKRREYTLMEKPLPFAVLDLLSQIGPINHRQITERFGNKGREPLTRNEYNLAMPYGDWDKHVVKQAGEVLDGIGGARISANGNAWWEFDYDPSDVKRLITVTGMIPDHQSHQYFPTPDRLAQKAVLEAGVHSGVTCLEPSAGCGSIADYMKNAREVTCIEVSALHCRVLESKGHSVYQADFLEWAEQQDALLHSFDRVIMNPPYSQGRWQAHTEAAATMLAPGGRLVAILPSSAQGKFHLPGMTCRWEGPYDNQFPGASMSVSILIAEAA